MPGRHVPGRAYFWAASPGFTFIELLVTFAILGILMAITVVSFLGANKNARDTKRKAELQEIKGAIEEYRLVNGQYPTSNDTSVDGVFLPSLQPDFLSRNYLDPSNGVTYYYEYRYVGAAGCSYALLSKVENTGNVSACPAACNVGSSGVYCLSE